ncbi:hypothetical protein Sste5346_002315 [Sporothrix stenoceras]|uniref:Pheromone n=1 Tax=Sporothrix stenoceras TaxID=5173 RepID=A0ABR3ZK38_9PEZI
MKTTAIISVLAIGATSVSAAAIADAEASFCSLNGMPCWQAKRAAEAFANAISSSPLGDISKRSVGETSIKAMRSLDGLASIVASTQSNPRSFYSDLALASHFPAPAEDGVAKRDAEADAQWCPLFGQSCWKVKRAAEALINTIDGFQKNVEKRDASAQWCPLFGQSCWKRAAEPEAHAQWCPLFGQSCWKRDAPVESRCNAPGGACATAARDLHAMYNTARSVLEGLPQ